MPLDPLVTLLVEDGFDDCVGLLVFGDGTLLLFESLLFKLTLSFDSFLFVEAELFVCLFAPPPLVVVVLVLVPLPFSFSFLLELTVTVFVSLVVYMYGWYYY